MIKKLSSGAHISFNVERGKHSGSNNRKAVAASAKSFRGVVLPQTNEETLFVKLANGYNIGFKRSEVKNIKVESKKLTMSKVPTLKGNSKLPTLALVTTGGTITSSVDYKTGAVTSLTKPEELLAQIPALQKLANIKIFAPLNVMSEDMAHKDWQKLAKFIHKKLQDKSIRGVILTLGTDILHYVSAAMAFMLGKLDKPVAVVGGQRSSDRGSFDGAQNLICAAHYCLSDINQVAVVMHGTSEDTYCIASPGTKVRKMHTSQRDSFRPINTLPLAKIWPDGKIEKLKTIPTTSTKFNPNFSSKIALVKFIAGVGPEIFDYYVSKGCKGIIVEGTGLGHLPVSCKHTWIPSLKKAIKSGVFVGMTTQCLYGSANPHVYTNLRLVADTGVTYLKDMLPEAAFVKLGCTLARTKKLSDVKKLMLQNWTGEISERIEEGTFLY